MLSPHSVLQFLSSEHAIRRFQKDLEQTELLDREVNDTIVYRDLMALQI